MKKNLFAILSVLMFATNLSAQVQQKVLVEHFTNTNCSVCASRNPAFYTNLNAQSGVIYLSVHPSSPYQSCLLSQQNKADNDARTNYYGIYGSTPRLAMQGDVVSAGANYGDASIFSNYLGNTTPLEIVLSQQKFGTDSIKVRVVVKTLAAHNNDSLLLFAGLAEDTVFHQGTNGEKTHFNVLRKALNGASGLTIFPATQAGDSVVYEFSSGAASFWNFNRIYSIAFVQTHTSKDIVQVQALQADGNSPVTSLNKTANLLQVQMYPNPASGSVNFVMADESNYEIFLYSTEGKLLERKSFSGSFTFDTGDLSAGLYLVKIVGEAGIFSSKLQLR